MHFFSELTFGVCYYPEHWEEKLWAQDIDRMLQNGITMIRIAEFAWSKFELREGVFDYSFFDHFLDVVEQTEMKVIFCTPTATPPAWLTEKYPEVLTVDADGRQQKHGVRRHYNYNSPIYREKTRIIVEALAKHYCNRKCIIGWQIDNELNCVTNEFYSEADNKAFRDFLKQKYISLDTLNEAWGTVFWNQTYTEWEEIFLPRHAQRKACNPHLKLDSLRFYSESCIAYAKLQHDILAQYLPEDAFITTNGIFKHVDYARLQREAADFISYDCYPGFGYMEGSDEIHDRKFSLSFAMVRGCSKQIGVMEQQSGPGGWYNFRVAPTAKPGQLRLWTYQSIANGSDFVCYFRWRTCTFGTEIYWHGILGYDNRDNRRLKEIGDTIKEVQSIPKLGGSTYTAKVALLRDYDNEWDGETDVWHGPVRDYSQMEIGKALLAAHIPFTYVTISEETRQEDLAGFEIIFAPHMSIVDPVILEKIKVYVRNGGRFVSGARTGYKDLNGRCPMKIMPVDMNDLFGIEIREFTAVMPWEKQSALMGEEHLDMPKFCDMLTPIADTCRVMAVYEYDYYKGQAAVTENGFGKGYAYYYGAAFERKAVRAFLDRIGIKSPIQGKISAPEDCEIAIRSGEEEYVFLLNYAGEERTVTFHRPYQNMVNHEIYNGNYTLNKYDVLVLKKSEGSL